jgi:hypothetical protein
MVLLFAFGGNDLSEIIRSYGLFWKADQVFWNSSSKNAALLCHPARAKSRVVNIKDQVGIYVLYEGHQIVYVGQVGAGNSKLFSRLKRHRADHLAGRWDTFSWFGLRKILASGELSTESLRTTSSKRVSLNQVEAVMIASAEPRLNKQGGRFGKNATKCVQVRDPRLGKTDSEKLEELWRYLRGSQKN